jgi:hypothetical protein
MEEEFMKRLTVRSVQFVFVAALVLGSGAIPSQSQQKKMPQTAGVDNSKMGPYRALAQLAVAASQKGDNAAAATLAEILERTWDKAEDYGGDTALSKTNRKVFDEVDKAMDKFITILLKHANSAPDAGALKSAYADYLAKLQSAE